MRRDLTFLALLLCAAATPGMAQQTEFAAQPLPDTSPLAITIAAPPAVREGADVGPADGRLKLPQFVTITLTNTSDREVRFPMPAIGCRNDAIGTVELLMTPAADGAGVCAPGDAEAPSLKKWMTLRPGETANFGEPLIGLSKGAATVELRGRYTPPQFAGSMTEELYRRSVTYPTEQLTSAASTVVRAAD